MKFLKITAALFAVATMVQAQFVQGPVVRSVITNLTTLAIPPADGATTGATNITSYTTTSWLPVGKDGFGFAIKAYGTNAALTTNVWFVFVTSPDGVLENTNQTITVAYLPLGVATNTYYTNIVTSTSANYGNISAVKLKTVTQTNGLVGGSLAGRLFIEKFYITTR
jgi:hypothetical protein